MKGSVKMEYSELIARATEIVNAEEIDVAELSTIIVDLDTMYATVLAERDNALDSFGKEVEKNAKLQETNHDFMKRLTDKAIQGEEDDEPIELSEEEIEDIADEVIEELAEAWLGE